VIGIKKGEAPAGLVRDGEVHTAELRIAYESNEDLYRTKEMPLRESIYRAVKAELEARQHGKCCYCEVVFDDHKPHADTCVEHWRPKLSSRQEQGATRIRPGYYWLAYNWDNLLVSCSFCNRKKNDLFPLANPARRALHHGMPIEDEEPAILKPDGKEDVRLHITFYNEVPVGITDLGRETIKVLELDSLAHGLRKKHFAAITEAVDLCRRKANSVDQVDIYNVANARRFLADAARPEAKYSAMVVAYLDANPLPEGPA
jgi:hypothetical protein